MSDNTTSEIQPDQRVNWRVSDFCQAHGIGRTSFYEEVKRGELKIIKHGKRTLIPNVEAKAWQERKMAEARACPP
jgi:hypothetical protein